MSLVFFALSNSIVFGQDTYRDNFSTVSYSNNDGNQNWSSNWIETGDTNTGPTSQYILISSNQLAFNYLFAETIRRSANLSSYSTAVLSFDWNTVSLETGETLAVQMSSDGTNYATLTTFSGTQSGTFTQDISSYISATTTIRFLKGGNNWSGTNDQAFVDNVLISATSTPNLSIDDISVNENAGTATFTVTHSGIATSGPFTVDYTTADVTAASGVDYVANNGTLSFNGSVGDIEQITVSIIDNSFYDGDLTYNIQFSNVSDTSVGITDVGLGTILDDEVILNDVPLTLYDSFNGYFDYAVTGGSFRTQQNSNTNGAAACQISTTSTANGLTTTIPPTGTIQKAYLMWAHSNINPDFQVTFEGQTVNAQLASSFSSTLGHVFYGMVADVTPIILGIANPSTHTYSLTNLAVDNTNNNAPYCTNAVVLGGWSLMVFYEEPSLPAVSINLYNGFDGAQGTATTSTSSNFSLSGFYAIGSVGSKTSVLSWEGDVNLANSESLVFTTPSSGSNTLSGDGGQTGTNPFNSTIYDNTGPTMTPPTPIVNNATSYGVDLDTYDVSAFIQQGESTATTTVNVGQDLVIMNSVLLKVPSNLIVGTVFEDVNYGGGAGRDLASSSGVPIPGAIVELYDNTGTLFDTQVTDATGGYLFGGMANGTYSVRVVNNTVRSNRTGGASCASCLGVQTYEASYAASTLSPVTNEVGGANPAGIDTATGVLTGAQTVATVTIANEGAIGMDFGFNFNTIVNTNASGQGSLEQFILNSNNLDETGLDIEANSIFDPLAGEDVSIFMIPTATDPLGRGVDGNYANGYFDISIAGSLSPITADNTKIDGRTQTAYSGDTNTGTVGAGGTLVGVSAIALPNYELPEIQISDSSGDLIQIQGSNTLIRNIAAYTTLGTIITIQAGDDNVVSNSLIGVNALGLQSSNSFYGIEVVGANIGPLVIDANYIARNNTSGIYIHGGNSTKTITNNHIFLNGNSACDRNVRVENGSDGVIIQYNLIEDSPSIGITNTGPGNLIITENTITGSGQNGGLCSGRIENVGIRLRGDNSLISQNIIYDNGGAGIVLYETSSSGNLISQNSIYNNGTTGDALGIDLTTSIGVGDGVTLNDNGDADNGANGLANFPIITSAFLSGTNLVISGWARPGATIEVFLTDISEGTASAGDNELGLSTDYGEGQTYLGTIIEGSASDQDSNASAYTDVDGNSDNTNRFQVAFPIDPSAIVTVGNFVTTTATVANATSEFSPFSIVKAYNVITNRRITYRVNKN